MSFVAAAFIGAGGAVIGGAIAASGARSAADSALKGQERAAALLREATAKATDQVFKLVDVGEQNLLTGSQAALNILGKSVGPTMDLSRGGNIAAQETLLAGMPQVEAALRGQPVDYSQLQVYKGAEVPEIDYQLPEFEDTISEELLAGTDAEQEAAAINQQAEDTVTSMYMELLGREPDASGMAWWKEKITNDQGLVVPSKVNKFKNKVMRSTEYRNKQAAKAAAGGAGANMLGANVTLDANWSPVTMGRKGLS